MPVLRFGLRRAAFNRVAYMENKSDALELLTSQPKQVDALVAKIERAKERKTERRLMSADERAELGAQM